MRYLVLMILLLCPPFAFPEDNQEQMVLSVRRAVSNFKSAPDSGYQLKLEFTVKSTEGDVSGSHLLMQSGRRLRSETMVGSYRENFIQDDDKAWRYRSSLQPLSVMEMLAALYPATLDAESNRLTLGMVDQSVEGESLRCIRATYPENRSGVWCLYPDTKLLHWYIADDTFATRYSDYATFTERSFPRTMTTYELGREAVRMHVTGLEAAQVSAEELVPTPEMKPAAPRLGCPSPKSDGVVENKVSPEYPMAARLARIQGRVALYATIATDGTIANLTTIGNPFPLLERAARDAVMKWRFKPLLLCGQPTDVTTFIFVNFQVTNN